LTATLDDLTQQLLSLPIDERATLAQRLWASLDVDPSCAPKADRELVDTLKRRNADMDRGAVQGRSHSEVMAAARKSLHARLMESGS
jgi:putative addiction module component (TIGR02574 family)